LQVCQNCISVWELSYFTMFVIFFYFSDQRL
jgi:hypothetical protein